MLRGDSADLWRNTNDILQSCLMIMFIGIGMFVGRIVWRFTLFMASQKIEAGLRHDMFLKGERLSISYYHQNSVGTIMSWFTSDLETIEEFVGWGYHNVHRCDIPLSIRFNLHVYYLLAISHNFSCSNDSYYFLGSLGGETGHRKMDAETKSLRRDVRLFSREFYRHSCYQSFCQRESTIISVFQNCQEKIKTSTSPLENFILCSM